jgi:hypothetical protein
MILLGWGSLSGGLLLVCLASFSWAMRKFFSKPAGDNSGMKAIRYCGAVFAIIHLAAIVATPKAPARQALGGASSMFWR